MEFNEINRLNPNIPLPSPKDNSDKKKSVENKNHNITSKKAPSNPNYWQGAFGVKKNSKSDATNNIFSEITAKSISNIKTDVNIPISENESVALSEYLNYLLTQPVGFQTEEEYQQYVIDSLSKNFEAMKQAFETQENQDGVISKGYNAVKNLTSLGLTNKDIETFLIQQEEMINYLNASINEENNLSFEEVFEQFTGVEYSKEKINSYMQAANIHSAIMVGCQHDDDFLKKFKEATGKSVEEAAKCFASCQLNTFGKATEIYNLAEKYVQDQQGFKDKLSSIISTLGLGCIAAGAITSFFCPPVGISMLTLGKTVSLSGMFVDNVMDLVDKSTDKNGLTKTEIGNLALETGVEAISYGVGRTIGKFTNNINNVVAHKLTEKGTGEIASKVVGQITETTTDTALSLGADFTIAQGQSLIINGKLMNSKDYWSMDRLLGEGKNQLIGILTGISSGKINAYQQGVITTAQAKILSGDIDGAKAHFKQSGMKMNDTSFQKFVEQVNTTKVSSTNGNVIEESSDNSLTDDNGDSKKIGIQFFAQSKMQDTAQLEYEKQLQINKDYFRKKRLKDTYIDSAARLKTAGFNDKFAIHGAKKYTPEEINVAVKLKENGFVEVFEVADDYDFVVECTRELTAEQIDIAIKLKEFGFGEEDAFGYVIEKFSYEEAIISRMLIENGYDDYDANEKAKNAPPELASLAIKLKENELDNMLNSLFDDFDLALEVARELTAEKIDIVIKLKEFGFGNEDALSLAIEGYSLEQAELFRILKEDGYSEEQSFEQSKKLTKEQADIAVRLKNIKFSLYDAIRKAEELTPEQAESANILLKNDFDNYYIFKSAKAGLTKEQADFAVKMKEKGNYDSYAIEKAMKLLPEQAKAASELLDCDYDDYDAVNIAKELTTEEAKTINKLVKNGFNSHEAIEGAKSGLTPEQVDIAIELKHKGLGDYKAIYGATAGLTIEQADTVMKLIENGFDEYSAIEGTSKGLTIEQVDFAIKIKQKGFDDDAAIKASALRLSEEQLTTAASLKQEIKAMEYDYKDIDIIELLRLTPEEINRARSLLANNKGTTNKLSCKSIAVLAKFDNYEEAHLKLEEQRELILKHPEQYINGKYETTEEMRDAVNEFFSKNKDLIQLAALYDKQTLDALFRKRFEDVEDYIETMSEIYDIDSYSLHKKLLTSKDENGNAFTSNQQIEFMNIIAAYKLCNQDYGKIYEMINSSGVNISALNRNLFNQIMKYAGMSDNEIASIPQEKLSSWDSKYIHFLLSEIAESEDRSFKDILKVCNLGNFEDYIYDKNNIYGRTNAKTKTYYRQKGLDYDRWIHPSKDNEVKFQSIDKNMQQISQISAQIEEDMNSLMQTPAKGFIKKQFPAFIKEDNFVIPQNYKTKAKLTELAKTLSDTTAQGQMQSIWARAEQNKNNPNKAQTAAKTLTVLSHLNQRLDDLSNVKERAVTKNIDVTIKMWDRNPQKDIFQGNHSTCCIAMGGGNGRAMPHYLVNTSYNMIEIVDNQSGKIIGNALCYFATEESGNPIFIIDNVEIKNSIKPSDEVGVQLRNAIVEYAQNITQDITGDNDTPIYMSGSYNDIPINNLPQTNQTVSLLGDIDCDDIYMDLYGGWVNKNNLTKECELLRLT